MSGDLTVIVFAMGEDRYALPVAMVREILEHRTGFRLPGAPDWLIGLTDVRGRSLPMADLRRCLGLAAVPPTALTRLLVVELPGTAATPFEIGLVVDMVCEIAVVAADAVEPPPGVGGIAGAAGLQSMLRQEDGLVGLLDLPAVLAAQGAGAMPSLRAA